MRAGMVRIPALKSIKNAVSNKLAVITNAAFGGKCLFYTNVSLSCGLSGVGDFLEQQWEMIKFQNDKDWNRKRTLKMAISGITVGIFCHHYYRYLDVYYPGRTFKTVAKKLLIDQVICSPISITIFYLTVSTVEGQNWPSFINEFKQKAWRLYAAEWVVWPAAQVVNFCFLPPRYRVLYDNAISLGYDVYTSYVKHDEEDS